ncbi:MAG: hypothetical protein MJ188_08200 [Treponema sp.]|nr:hypothetical protein [Treponema sp.]
MTRKKIRLILSATALTLVFLCTSCSQVLNALIIPFAPSFVPKVEYDDIKGAIISYDFDIEKHKDKDEPRDWNMGYACYIWRSTTSPYADFELIYRVYNPNAVGKYTGHNSEGESVEYDFRLPDDTYTRTKNVRCQLAAYNDKTAKGFVTDVEATKRTCYYRISKIKLTSDYYYNEDEGYSTLSYSLSDDTSGWATVGEN